jgi:hypothetical protein
VVVPQRDLLPRLTGRVLKDVWAPEQADDLGKTNRVGEVTNGERPIT